MMDLFDLTSKNQADVQVFNTPSAGTTDWYTWRKPRGKSFAQFLCLAGGGGGGGGCGDAGGANKGGGGGGSSSAIARVMISLELLPDVLYVNVGRGGIGGAGGSSGSGTGGGNGVQSYISLQPNTTTSNLILQSGGATGLGGNPGTATNGGAATSFPAATTISTCPISGLGFNLPDFQGGDTGKAGGAHTGAIGAATAILTTGIFVMGGSGGAGSASGDFAGGLCTAIANSYLSEQRPIGAAAGSNPGSNGPTLWKPMWFFGGLGGGSSNTTTGGAGGYGSYGCGGGGGGAGVTVGGRGGDGGPGLVLISCW
jgi:hypothetical protein